MYALSAQDPNGWRLLGLYTTLDMACVNAQRSNYMQNVLYIYLVGENEPVQHCERAEALCGRFAWDKNAFFQGHNLLWVSEEFAQFTDMIELGMGKIRQLYTKLKKQRVALTSLCNLDAKNMNAPFSVAMIFKKDWYKPRATQVVRLSGPNEFMDMIHRDVNMLRYVNGQLDDHITDMKGRTGFIGTLNDLVVEYAVGDKRELMPSYKFNV